MVGIKAIKGPRQRPRLAAPPTRSTHITPARHSRLARRGNGLVFTYLQAGVHPAAQARREDLLHRGATRRDPLPPPHGRVHAVEVVGHHQPRRRRLREAPQLWCGVYGSVSVFGFAYFSVSELCRFRFSVSDLFRFGSAVVFVSVVGGCHDVMMHSVVVWINANVARFGECASSWLG